MQHKLIAVCGRSAQIVTETVWALSQKRGIPLAAIHIVTTLEGYRTLRETLLDPRPGPLQRLYREYGLDPGALRFSEDTIHILKDAGGKELEDIRSAEENERARDQIFALVQRLAAAPGVCLHGSIAGGRKSMGYLLGSAFHFFGRPGDRLYHVLVSPPELENHAEFFYIPRREHRFEFEGGTISTADARIELAELPCISVREMVAFGAEADYNSIRARAQEEIRRHRRIEEENIRLRRDLGHIGRLIGESRPMRRVKEQITRYAETEITVLISGETGTGKELVARSLWELSARRKASFEVFNCGALAETLMETDLFGALQGAYTDLKTERKGAFRKAHGGTLFLDEIADLPPKGQVDLLRVLQEKKVRPLGSDTEEEVDVRLICATNQNLEEMVRKGRFREDLFFRLRGGEIELPPLRRRREDIEALLRFFLEKCNRNYQREIIGFAPEALQRLRAYDWPGNVRELEYVVERIAAEAPRGAMRIKTAELPPQIRWALEGDCSLEDLLESSVDEAVRRLERMKITRALEEVDGNKSRAIQSLGKSRPWLDRRLAELGLEEWSAALKTKSQKM